MGMVKLNYSRKELVSILHNFGEEHQLNIQFAAVIGSKGVQLDMGDSDYDVGVVVDKLQKDIIWCKEYRTSIDICLLEYGAIEKARACLPKLEFPSVVHRDNVQFDYKSTEYQQNEEIATFLIPMICSNEILVDNTIVKSQVRSIDVIDYFYTRAYGNLINNLRNDRVMARKYLMTVYGILQIDSVLRWNKVQKGFYTVLESANGIEAYRVKIQNLLEANKRCGKKAFVDRNEMLNEFISMKLLDQKQKITEFEKDIIIHCD